MDLASSDEIMTVLAPKLWSTVVGIQSLARISAPKVAQPIFNATPILNTLNTYMYIRSGFSYGTLRNYVTRAK